MHSFEHADHQIPSCCQEGDTDCEEMYILLRRGPGYVPTNRECREVVQLKVWYPRWILWSLFLWTAVGEDIAEFRISDSKDAVDGHWSLPWRIENDVIGEIGILDLHLGCMFSCWEPWQTPPIIAGWSGELPPCRLPQLVSAWSFPGRQDEDWSVKKEKVTWFPSMLSLLLDTESLDFVVAIGFVSLVSSRSENLCSIWYTQHRWWSPSWQSIRMHDSDCFLLRIPSTVKSYGSKSVSKKTTGFSHVSHTRTTWRLCKASWWVRFHPAVPCVAFLRLELARTRLASINESIMTSQETPHHRHHRHHRWTKAAFH